MFDDRFRRLIAPLLRPLAEALVRAGVTANQVTLTAFVLGLAAAGLVGAGRVWAGILGWLASRLLDAVDGAVARAAPNRTALGGYLDITLDMAAYSLMLVAFAVIQPAYQVAWLLVLVGYVLAITSTAVLSSILEQQRTQIPENDRSLQFTPGLAEGGETTVVYVAFAALPSRVGVIVWIWIALLAATVVQRTVLARRLLRG